MSTTSHPGSNRMRPWAIVMAVIASLALVLGACSSDDKDDSDTSTTAAEDSAETQDPPDSDTAAGDPADFDDALDEANSLLDDSDDPCEIIAGISEISGAPDPQSKEQTQEFVDYYTRFFDKLADGMDDAAGADSLRGAAAAIDEYAADVDYDIDAMGTDDSPLIDMSADVQTALNSLTTQCGPEIMGGSGDAG